MEQARQSLRDEQQALSPAMNSYYAGEIACLLSLLRHNYVSTKSKEPRNCRENAGRESYPERNLQRQEDPTKYPIEYSSGHSCENNSSEKKWLTWKN